MSTPASPDVPPTVGPFTVRSVLASTPDGHLVEATDQRGRQVDLVLLGGGAGDDPAARDRFVGSAEGMYRADQTSVLGASPAGSRAWVALPPGAGAAQFEPLLRSAGPAGPGASPRGPDFDPYWRGRTSRAGWQDGLAHWSNEPVTRPWWHRWWIVALILVLLIAVLLLLSQCAPRGEPQPSPTSGSSTSTQSPSETTSGSPTPSGSSSGPEPSRSPTPSPSGDDSGPSGSGSPTRLNPA